MAKVRSGQAVARRTARPVEKSGPMTRTNTIEAKLTGDAICTAEGHTVKAGTPVIVLCRALVEAGYDPASPMKVYRGIRSRSPFALSVKPLGCALRAKATASPSIKPHCAVRISPLVRVTAKNSRALISNHKRTSGHDYAHRQSFVLP